MIAPLGDARDSVGFSRVALEFAWRSLIRQPARAALGILGVAAVGALLFDMLMLSGGLVISMRDLLDRMGFEIRVTAGDELGGPSPEIPDGAAAAEEISALPSVRSVTTIRTEYADIEGRGGVPLLRASLVGIGGAAVRPWTILRGWEPGLRGELVVNEAAAASLGVEPGGSIKVQAMCFDWAEAQPAMMFRVTGVAEFPFNVAGLSAAGTTAESLAAACGEDRVTVADFMAVISTGDPDAAAREITAARPDLRAFTNAQAVGQFQQRGFTYFRQISAVLTAVTLSFAVLLITVLLTVSVNQRLGEVAALRALGFSRGRVALDVLFESALIVGIGGALSLPLGALLALWLDAILKSMPGIPSSLHFFVFQPQNLVVHLALLASTAFIAALYPMRIVARLPIATTLRNEVVS
jgi:ABC-type lipoprotein release transport system permease subunit